MVQHLEKHANPQLFCEMYPVLVGIDLYSWQGVIPLQKILTVGCSTPSSSSEDLKASSDPKRKVQTPQQLAMEDLFSDPGKRLK